MLMQNFGGQIRCILGNVEMANERVHHAALSDRVSQAHAMTREEVRDLSGLLEIGAFMANRFAVL